MNQEIEKMERFLAECLFEMVEEKVKANQLQREAERLLKENFTINPNQQHETETFT